MEEYIQEKNFVTMEDLCREFSISINTARSDIATLADSGRVKKMYGGVSRNQSVQYTTFEIREKQHMEEKNLIAAAAARLITDGDIIFIDNGTTGVPIIDHLPESINITIITNNLSVINRAVGLRNSQIVTLGGFYQPKTNSFACTITDMVEQIKMCNITKAFLGATGISSTGNLTNSVDFERAMKSTIVQYSDMHYVMADSSKCGKAALLTYANLSDMTAWITDSGVPDAFRKLCRESDTQIIFADRKKN